ncbi:tyrosine-type recombinase/integrase [Candidatus Obscuribacterales bacterium]|nr:tyrosine-type recombinase/integrase [Candidatus Obscuribacterales bacterium]
MIYSANPIRTEEAAALEGFKTSLDSQSMAAHTQRAYVSRVRKFLSYMNEQGNNSIQQDGGTWHEQVNGYVNHLKTVEAASQNTVNNVITALEKFVDFLGADMPRVARESWPKSAPRPLSEDEERRFVEATYRHRSAKDRAISFLLLYTGMKIGECVGLNMDDVLLAADTGRVMVKGSRVIPLNAPTRKALYDWLTERSRRFGDCEEKAVFLNPMGRRISTVGVDCIVRKIGHRAHLNLSAQVLRDTCLTNLVRNGNDLMLVAAIGGHRTLETTKRYAGVSGTPAVSSEVMESLTNRVAAFALH